MCRGSMQGLLERKAAVTDRAVLLLILAVNAAAIAKLQLTPDTLIGAFNGTVAGALLAASIWQPLQYPRWRMVPVILLRLSVCALPLVSDTVGPFARAPLGLPAAAAVAAAWPWPWLIIRGAFLLLVGISWAVGLFTASFLLLPPAHHLAVSAVSLAALLSNNRAVCQQFIAQDPANGELIRALDSALQALMVSVSPAAQQYRGDLARSRQDSCMAGAAALQVSLGLVLPTMLVWTLQSRMAASIAAQARAARDSAMVAQVQRSQHATLCFAVTSATRGPAPKLVLTGLGLLLTYLVALLLLPLLGREE